MSAVPTDADTLTHLPLRHLLADRFYSSHDFMTRHSRIADDGEQTVNRHSVAVTDAASFDPHPYFACSWSRNVPRHQLKVSPGPLYFDVLPQFAEGYALVLAGRFSEAIQKFDAALQVVRKRDPADRDTSACLMNMLGFAELQQGNYGVAAVWFQRGLVSVW